MNMNMNVSPFKSVLPGDLPEVFRDQFLSEGTEPVRLTGTMQKIWFPPLLKPLFWLAGQFRTLIPYAGENISATLTIVPEAGQQIWKRELFFHKVVHFDTKMVFVPELKRAAERAGPGGILQMTWDIQMTGKSAMVWKSCRWQVCLGKRTLTIPSGLGRWLFGEVFFRQTAVTQNGHPASRIEMNISHPLFPTFFTYSGIFTVQKEQNHD